MLFFVYRIIKLFIGFVSSLLALVTSISYYKTVLRKMISDYYLRLVIYLDPVEASLYK